ncbi:DUF6415 family natural product biosynthesis protein [Streptomyces achromogenes]|uniref:DUF6415 family natural product biosynthesis protein n=1 Tax=Streptomyces achromogenes TaxID=67255 RepID=UPI003421D87D
MRGYQVLHDPTAVVDLPLGREPHELLVRAVLAVTDPERLAPDDWAQIALQLTGHARAVAQDVERLTGLLPRYDPRRVLAEDVLRQARQRLDAPMQGTLRCAQGRAHTVRELYARLDRLRTPRPASRR